MLISQAGTSCSRLFNQDSRRIGAGARRCLRRWAARCRPPTPGCTAAGWVGVVEGAEGGVAVGAGGGDGLPRKRALGTGLAGGAGGRGGAMGPDTVAAAVAGGGTADVGCLAGPRSAIRR